MALRRNISAREIIHDLKSGLNSDQIRAKYHLTRQGLTRVLRKLVVTRLMSAKDLCDRTGVLCDGEVIELRKHPRYTHPQSMMICDLNDMTCDLAILDASEGGFRLAGTDATVGEEKTFLVTAKGMEDPAPFSIKAQCRWVEPGPQSGLFYAGFEITVMSPVARESWRKLLVALSV